MVAYTFTGTIAQTNFKKQSLYLRRYDSFYSKSDARLRLSEGRRKTRFHFAEREQARIKIGCKGI